LRILLLGIVVFSVQKVLATTSSARGRAKWFLRATLLSMAVNVGLNLWLIPLLAGVSRGRRWLPLSAIPSRR
jgi:O-antigen/teichoic acid export membrane protein